MRSRNAMLAMAVAMSAMSAGIAAGNAAPEPDHKPEPPEDEREKQRAKDAARAEEHEPAKPLAKPLRALTEADNTRLREAAERRWRKAQRQARGMLTSQTGESGEGKGEGR